MTAPVLARRLGTRDAVAVGLGAMLGAGIFSAPAPAARCRRGLAPAGGARGRLRRLVQRHLERVARGGVAAGRRHLRLRGPDAGTGLGTPGRLGLRHREDRLLCRHGPHGRCLRMAAAAPGRRPRSRSCSTVALGTGGVQRGARLTRVLLAVVLAVLTLVVVAAAVVGAEPAASGRGRRAGAGCSRPRG